MLSSPPLPPPTPRRPQGPKPFYELSDHSRWVAAFRDSLYGQFAVRWNGVHKSKKTAYQAGVYKARLAGQLGVAPERLGDESARLLPALLRPHDAMRAPPPPSTEPPPPPPPAEPLAAHAFPLPGRDAETPLTPSLAALCRVGTACPSWRARLLGSDVLRQPVRAARVAIVTLHAAVADGDEALPSYVRAARRATALYASAHGYTFIAHNDSLAADRHPAWSKVAAVQRFVRSLAGGRPRTAHSRARP